MKFSLTAIAVVLLVAVASPSTRAQECLEYGPTVTLTGRLQSRVFAGPPHWESIRNGDSKETALILRLAKPICTNGNDPLGYDISLTNIREIQLVVINDAQRATIRRRLGKSIELTGSLFGGHSGYHQTKVLIDVSSIRVARPNQQPTRPPRPPARQTGKAGRDACGVKGWRYLEPICCIQ